MAGNTDFFAKAAYRKVTWKDIFSNIFKKHNKEDGARLYMAGASLRLVKQGAAQCTRIPQTAADTTEDVYAPSQNITLRGLSGLYKGSVFPALGGRLVIGWDTSRVNIVYPPDTRGISGVHCELLFVKGMPVLIDKNSSGGTFLEDGTRLAPERPYPLLRKSVFYLAGRENMFVIE